MFTVVFLCWLCSQEGSIRHLWVPSRCFQYLIKDAFKRFWRWLDTTLVFHRKVVNLEISLCVAAMTLKHFLFFLYLSVISPQDWVAPWRVSVYAPVLQGLPHMWVGAAVMEVVRVEEVLLARGRCAAADVMGSKMLTWTLSSQRRWHCIWTLQALPLLEGEEPGNETPPSVVMSSQTPLLTNAIGWSDLLPAYVCEGSWGRAFQAKARRAWWLGLCGTDALMNRQTFRIWAVQKNLGGKWKQELEVLSAVY